MHRGVGTRCMECRALAVSPVSKHVPGFLCEQVVAITGKDIVTFPGNHDVKVADVGSKASQVRQRWTTHFGGYNMFGNGVIPGTEWTYWKGPLFDSEKAVPPPRVMDDGTIGRPDVRKPAPVDLMLVHYPTYRDVALSCVPDNRTATYFMMDMLKPKLVLAGHVHAPAGPCRHARSEEFTLPTLNWKQAQYLLGADVQSVAGYGVLDSSMRLELCFPLDRGMVLVTEGASAVMFGFFVCEARRISRVEFAGALGLVSLVLYAALMTGLELPFIFMGLLGMPALTWQFRLSRESK